MRIGYLVLGAMVLALAMPATIAAQYIECATCGPVWGPGGGQLCRAVVHGEGSTNCSSGPTECVIFEETGHCRGYWWECRDGNARDCFIYVVGTDGGLTPNGAPLWAWAPVAAQKVRSKSECRAPEGAESAIL
jgi:hypothetical protein